MSKEYIAEQDAAMRSVILSIPTKLYEGNYDIVDANLASMESNNASFPILYKDGPSLLTQDIDGTSVFSMVSSLTRSERQPGKVSLGACLSESEAIAIPSDLLTPNVTDYLEAEGLTSAALAGLSIRKKWTYSAFADHEKVSREVYTMVAIGSQLLILHPDVSIQDQNWGPLPTELISTEALQRIPVPSKEELGVERFNRIVKGLGYDALQI